MKQVFNREQAPSLLFFCLLMISLSQCSGTKQDGSLKDAMLWRITRNDLQKPSYLFGTVHLADSAEIPVHKTVIEQLNRADLLVFETDLTREDYLQKALEQAMMASDSLESVMSGKQVESVRSFFMDTFQFPLELVDRMKPFYLASLIGSLQSRSNSTSHEQRFMELARQEGKPIRGISTLEKESELLDRIPLEEQVTYLLDEIENYRSGRSGLQEAKIMEDYRAAAIEKIHASVYESLNRYDSIYACMFSLRNESWLPRMTELMQEGSCFFAVGAGHLAGESGLIRLLMDQGYKVVPVHLDFWFHD